MPPPEREKRRPHLAALPSRACRNHTDPNIVTLVARQATAWVDFCNLVALLDTIGREMWPHCGDLWVADKLRLWTDAVTREMSAELGDRYLDEAHSVARRRVRSA